jgi:type II secretory pathway component PulC
VKAAFLLSILLPLAACAGRESEADFPASEVLAESDEDDAMNSEPARPAPPTGSLWRDEVHATVDAGLGWFLQRVEVEPAVEAGRFRGFRVVRLRPPEFWQGVDLRPGDVVLSVNGLPIERETQAYEAFQSLKKATELRVRYARGGTERDLVFRIVSPPAEPEAKAVSDGRTARAPR